MNKGETGGWEEKSFRHASVRWFAKDVTQLY